MDKLYWKRFFANNFRNSLTDGEEGFLYFDLYVDGNIKKGSALVVHGITLDKLTNPDYELYEKVKRILKNYLELRGGGSSALASSSSHYQNCLHVLSCISSCADLEELEIWENKFKSKFG